MYDDPKRKRSHGEWIQAAEHKENGPHDKDEIGLDEDSRVVYGEEHNPHDG